MTMNHAPRPAAGAIRHGTAIARYRRMKLRRRPLTAQGMQTRQSIAIPLNAQVGSESRLQGLSSNRKNVLIFKQLILFYLIIS